MIKRSFDLLLLCETEFYRVFGKVLWNQKGSFYTPIISIIEPRERDVEVSTCTCDLTGGPGIRNKVGRYLPLSEKLIFVFSLLFLSYIRPSKLCLFSSSMNTIRKVFQDDVYLNYHEQEKRLIMNESQMFKCCSRYSRHHLKLP